MTTQGGGTAVTGGEIVLRIVENAESQLGATTGGEPPRGPFAGAKKGQPTAVELENVPDEFKALTQLFNKFAKEDADAKLITRVDKLLDSIENLEGELNKLGKEVPKDIKTLAKPLDFMSAKMKEEELPDYGAKLMSKMEQYLSGRVKTEMQGLPQTDTVDTQKNWQQRVVGLFSGIKDNTSEWAKQNPLLAKGIGKLMGPLGIIAGAVTIGALVKSSKVATSYLSSLWQLLGAFVDVFLMPFIPMLTRLLNWLAEKLPDWANFMQNLANDPWGTIKGIIGSIDLTDILSIAPFTLAIGGIIAALLSGGGILSLNPFTLFGFGKLLLPLLVGAMNIGKFSIVGISSFIKLLLMGAMSFGKFSITGLGPWAKLLLMQSMSFSKFAITGLASWVKLLLMGSMTFGSFAITGMGAFIKLLLMGAMSFGSFVLTGLGPLISALLPAAVTLAPITVAIGAATFLAWMGKLAWDAHHQTPEEKAYVEAERKRQNDLFFSTFPGLRPPGYVPQFQQSTASTTNNIFVTPSLTENERGFLIKPNEALTGAELEAELERLGLK